MKLYTAGFDQNYIIEGLPLLFILIELFQVIRNASNCTITVAGHFKETQGRAILESVINLGVSVALVFPLGIKGVLLGTIAAMLYRTNDMMIYSNRMILHRSPWITYKITLINIAVMAGVTYVAHWVPFNNSSYFHLALSVVLTMLVVLPLFYAVVFLLCPKQRQAVLQFLRSLRRRKEQK